MFPILRIRTDRSRSLRRLRHGSVLALVAALLAPAPAQALNIDVNVNVGISVPTPPAGRGGLADAFANSGANLLEEILCPLTTGVAAVTSAVPGVGTLVDQLPRLACSLNILGYVYRTTYIPPSGPPVVRYTKALAGAPAPLNVDGIGTLPDFVGTLSLNLTLNGITLQVHRASGFPAGAKVAIEAIARNPATPGSYVGFGPDGTFAGTASSWSAKLSLLGLSSSTADLGLDIKASGAPARLTTLGEVFSGPNPDVPERTYRSTAAFAPVPETFTTRMVASADRQQAIVTSTPSTLTAQIAILTPGRDQRVGLTADKVPSRIDVVHTSTTDSETTTYDASGPITTLTGGYRDVVDGDLVTAAALDAWAVPAHIRFAQTGDTTFVGATDGGKFDRMQARFARGGDVAALDPSTASFARFHRTTTSAFTAALQITDLKSAEIDQGTPYGGRLAFASPLVVFPFTADDDVTGTHLEGSLSGMPLDSTVGIDLGNGKVTFNGNGTGIDQIHVKATRPTPFFTRVTRLEATLEDLPAEETIDVKQVDGAMSVDASSPLGAITLLASDGSGPPAIGGAAVSYDDTPTLYRAFARLSHLKHISFQTDPVIGDLQTSQPQVVTIRGNAGGLVFDGKVDELPAHLTFTMGPGAGGSTVIDFDSHGEEVATITANGTGLSAPTGMPKFDAAIEDLPSHLTVTLPATTGNVVFDAHGDHIGRVYLQAYGNTVNGVLPGRHRFYFAEGQYVLANLLGVGSAEFGMSGKPIHLKYDISSAPLDYAVDTTTGVHVDGVISNPQPATIDITSFDKAAEGEGGVKLDAHVDPANHTGDGSIGSISLVGTLDGSYLDTTIASVPANLTMCLQTDGGHLCRPTWIPPAAAGVVDPSFAMRFLPTKLDGNVPDAPLVVNGLICPDAGRATCQNRSVRTKRIVVDDLKFKTVEAAFGEGASDIWAAGNTWAPGSPSEGDHLTGRVVYWDGSDTIWSDPNIDLDLGEPAGFISMRHLFLRVQPGIVTTVTHNGTFTCGLQPHLTIGINNFPDIDALSGDLGIC